MRLPSPNGLFLDGPHLIAFNSSNGVYPSCPGGILGAPCRARKDICRVGCAGALAAATAACSGITAGIGEAACIAAAAAAADGCRRECDRI